jgi:Transglycosylase-like domain
VVQRESGGQNDLPNSAGPSGYYQITPSTCQADSGSQCAPSAYQVLRAVENQHARAAFDRDRKSTKESKPGLWRRVRGSRRIAARFRLRLEGRCQSGSGGGDRNR